MKQPALPDAHLFTRRTMPVFFVRVNLFDTCPQTARIGSRGGYHVSRPYSIEGVNRLISQPHF